LPKPEAPNRKLNLNWTTRHPGLLALLHHIREEVEATEVRDRARSDDVQGNFEACLFGIILDLFRARMAWPEVLVGIGMQQNYLQAEATSQYTPDFLTVATFKPAIEGLILLKYIETDGQFFRATAYTEGRTRRFRMSDHLFNRFVQGGFERTDVEMGPNAVNIFLRDEEKRLAPYGNLSVAETAQKNLQTINAALAEHWYDLRLSDVELRTAGIRLADREVDDPEIMLASGESVDLTQRSLYRVFNNKRWDHGGRFYGGWWQMVPSRIRQHIIIDGERTGEVDYSGLHPAMLLAKLGRAIPDDMYERCYKGRTTPERRKIVKRTLLTLINATDSKLVKTPKEYSQDITGMSWTAFKARVMTCYPEFEDYFDTGVGIELQYEDSCMAEAIMLRFAAQGEVCLPVHDSFVVLSKNVSVLENIMLEVFEERFGQKIGMKKSSLLFSHIFTDLPKPSKLAGLGGDGYEHRYARWRNYRNMH
jgi:hypothetical protein